MKQTAVEFLMNEMPLIDWKIPYWKNKLEKAKEIEKQQHEETFNQSRLAKIFEKDMPPVWESWEQYYNETFKSE